MGGPSFQDFVIEKPEHSPHYEYHLHDPEDPKSHRRAVYRFTVRSKQQPFMAALMGLVVLGQHVSALEATGLALVIVASIGVTLSGTDTSMAAKPVAA